MGQYYNVAVISKDRKLFLNRDVNGEYTMAKLMEHSWWKNPFVNTVNSFIYKTPSQVAWVGDYAETSEYYEDLWGENEKTQGVTENQLSLDGKYLCNHDTKEYVDCDDYYKKSVDDYGWCIHPLPLLTCIGNKSGGGDYYSSVGEEYVGSWYNNVISIEDDIPEGYEKLDLRFAE